MVADPARLGELQNGKAKLQTLRLFAANGTQSIARASDLHLPILAPSELRGLKCQCHIPRGPDILKRFPLVQERLGALSPLSTSLWLCDSAL